MGRRKQSDEPSEDYKLPPMLTDEGLENFMISTAFQAAYKRMMNGTASSQEITHFLKLGSSKNKKEMQILENQKDLLTAKTKAINDSEDFTKIAKEAMQAMSEYQGRGAQEDEE